MYTAVIDRMPVVPSPSFDRDEFPVIFKKEEDECRGEVRLNLHKVSLEVGF